VNLPAAQQTAGTINLPAGYYQVLVSLTKSGEYAGFPEIIHIYTGLTSSLAAQTFTDADFAAPEPVSALELSGTFTRPVTGQAPAASLNAAQYTGTIAWNPAVSGTFAASTPYTATVSLTAKPGYTFTGVAANAFTYTGAATVTNSANSGEVTIGFAATTSTGGQAGTSYGVDDGVIAVTADPADKTIKQGAAADLILTVPGGYTVTGWYIDGANVPALGTAATVTLDADDYDAKTHRVSVFVTKDGRPYSWSDTFTVEAAGGGPTPLNLAEFIAAAQAVTPNTPDTPVTLALDPSVSITDTTAMGSLRTTLAGLNGQYIVIDLSAYTFTLLQYEGNFNDVLTANAVVGVILPSTLVMIDTDAFTNIITGTAGLRSITIPAGVTAINTAFYMCSNLTRVTFEGNSAVVDAYAFTYNFMAVYNAASPKAGTYVLTGTTWSKE
jgi:hypothetical protein